MATHSRSLLAVLAALIAFAAVPSSADAATFGLTRLRENSSSGAENYIYTDGGTVFAQASIDSGIYYRFTVLDATGAIRAQSSCSQSLVKGTRTYTYAIQPTDPVTTTTAWRFRVEEWNNVACSGAAAKTSSLYFDIARASSFSDSALTSPRSIFGAGSSAYLKVAGLGRVKTAAATTAQADWITAWVRPSGSAACTNYLNADMPDSDASGVLAAGSYLKYRPNAGTPSAAWNLESNYETRPCVDLGAADEGVWTLYLQKDATHIVKLKAFTVDATPPDTTITSRPTGSTSFTSADLGFVASQPDATLECRIDGGAWGACTSVKHYSGLLPGAHTFDVRAIDPAGNVDPSPASATWTIDAALAEVTLTAPADGSATSDATPGFSGAAGNNPGDSATVTVKILRPVSGSPDQLIQTLAATRSGAAWSVTPTVALTDGLYKVHAEQANALSNVAFSEEHTFRVDTAAPDVSVLEPRIDTVTTDTTPQLWGTGGLVTGDDGDVTVKLWSGSSASGAPAQTATAAVDSSGHWTVDATPALSDGTYTVRAEQLDDADNLGVSRSHTFSIDMTPPDTSITAGPSGSTASTDASFRFTSPDADATFECLIDAGDWGPCNSPKAYSSLATGSHALSVRAVDAAGNQDPTPATATWTVDTALPAVTLANPADGSATNDSTPAFDGGAGTVAGDDPAVTVKVYRPVGGAPDELVQTRTASRAGDGSWSVAASPALPDGDYIARAEQLDGASNVGTSAAHTFTVDTTAPNTFFTQTPPAVTGATSADFRFDASETGVSFECRVDGGAWGACTSPVVRSGLSGGSHAFQVRATDVAGNTDATPASATWIVSTALPALALDAPVDATTTSDATPGFSGHAGTAAGDSGTVTLKVYRPVAGAPDTLVQTLNTTRSPSDGSWSVTASNELDDGHYVAYAEQAGSSGTAVTAATSFNVDTTPPHTTISSGPQGTTTATAASFSFSSTEAGSNFECRLDGGAWAPCTTPKSYTGLANGLHSFDVRATDGVGNVDPTPASRAWAVETSSAAVTLAAPADNAVTNDSTPLFSGLASTAAGDSNTVNVEVYRPVVGGADELVQTLSVVRSAVNGSWSVAASPALADGPYVAYATQDDSNSNTGYSAPRSFTVDATKPGVTLTTPAAGLLTNDTTPTLGGGAGNDSGDWATVTVKLYAGAGVSGSPVQTLPATRSGGSWSIAPTPLADGTYTAQAEQTDTAGNSGVSVPRSFSIDATAPDTAIGSGPSANTTATTADFSFSSAEPGATFECRLDAGTWTACASPKTYTGQAPGVHNFAVRALDAAGNADATPAARGWTIDAPAGGGASGGGTGTGGSTPGGTTPGGSTPSSAPLELKLSGRKTQRVRGKKPRLTLSAICSADCSMKLSGTILLSRARAAGVPKRQARPKKLKLSAKSYALAGTKTTRVVLAIPRKLARQILAGLKQRRKAKLTLTGAASGAGAAAPSRVLPITLKR
jgi:large repetitive protein